jgi:hypothetical protein
MFNFLKPKKELNFKLNKPNIDRFLYLKRMMDKVVNIKGDVVECGVGKGRTFQMLAILSGAQNKPLWGFDSFEGFPEPTPEDQSSRNPQKGEWKHIAFKDVYDGLHTLKLSPEYLSKIKVIKGFFDESLPKEINDINKISLLHLDVDLYQSYKVCLKYLFPKVATGGVILFDEYANAAEVEKFPGAKKAIDEYFAGTNDKIERDQIFGKYFLVKR